MIFLRLLILAFLVGTLPASAAPKGSLSRPAEKASDLERMTERLIAERIDIARAKAAKRAPRFQDRAILIDIARRRSQDMAEGRVPPGHYDRKGEKPAFNMIRWWMPEARAMGENVMMQQVGSFDAEDFAKTAVDGWMNSPGHRQNILDPHFTWSGIGVAIRGNQAFATQIFAGPSAPN